MNTNTHTPGPWTFACDTYGTVRHSKMAVVTGPDPDLHNMAAVYGVAHRIRNWDDARLIAAAPDLLEVVRLYLELSTDQPPRLAKLAREAVKKATGDH